MWVFLWEHYNLGAYKMAEWLKFGLGHTSTGSTWGGGAKETEPQAAESCPARKFQTALAHQNYSETKNKNVLTSGPLNMNLLGRDLGTCVSKSLCRWL